MVNHSVSGSVSGLNGTLVLRNNNRDEIVITSDGDFIFPADLGITNRYQVSVSQQPAGQTCSVANASGVITISDITDVIIICHSRAHTLSGTVSGLTGTLTLQNNGGDDLVINRNGTFAFDEDVAEGSVYNVTVSFQPPGQACLVTHGSGNMDRPVSNVSVTCH